MAESTAPVKRARVRKSATVADEGVHPSLAKYVQDPVILSKYFHREFGGVDDFTVLQSFYGRRKPVFLEGPTSSGKTYAIRAFAAHLGVPLFTIGGSGGTTESDLFGRWLPTGQDDELVWADGKVTTAARHGGILYIDEGSFIPPEITAALHELTDDRRMLTVKGAFETVETPHGPEHRELVLKAHDDLWIIMAGNVGYAGTTELNQAFRNRFSVIEWDYDHQVESQLIASGALLEFVGALRLLHSSGQGLYSPIPTKQFMDFEANVYELGWDFAVESLKAYFSEDERALVETTLNDGFSTRICQDYGIDFVEEYVGEEDDY